MEAALIGEGKNIVAIVVIAVLVMVAFYPLEVFIPEAFWPFMPEILLRYPIVYLLSQLVPAILFFGIFVVGVLMIRGLMRA